MNRIWEVRLVKAKDHIEGSFVTSNAVCADQEHIYLVSNRGELFVLRRDRSSDFPLIKSLKVSSQALTAVSGNEQHLYLTSADGFLRSYNKSTLELAYPPIQLSTFGLSSLAIQGAVYVAKGQTEIAAGLEHLFLSALNPGEIAIQAENPGRQFGSQFEVDSTVVFDKNTGGRILGIPNPPDIYNRSGQQVALYANSKVLIQTTPGCCGRGVFLHDLQTFSSQFVDVKFANAARTVTRLGSELLIVGTESGQVHAYEFEQGKPDFRSSLDLRLATGHTGPEDIEIRALWVDDFDEFVFAASSWGNDQARRPELPSLFVLEMLSSPATQPHSAVT